MISGLSLNAQAQTQEQEKTVLDPKNYFDQHVSMVTIHKKDGSTQDVNLVYNDGAKLYHKVPNMPKVQTIPLSTVARIVYDDGSQEILYGGAGTRKVTPAPKNTLAATTSAGTLAAAASGKLQTTSDSTPEEPQTPPANVQPVQAEVPGEINIVFDPVDTRGAQFFDVIIDDEYAATVNNETGAVVSTMSGNHKIEYYFGGNENLKVTSSLMQTRANNTYTVSLPYNIKPRARVIRNLDIDIDQRNGLATNLSSKFNKVTLGEQEEWDKSFFPFSYTHISMGFYPMHNIIPSGYIQGFSFDYAQNSDFTLSKMNGWYAGFLLGYSVTELLDFGFDSYGAGNIAATGSLGPTLSYYLSNGKTLTPFAGIELPLVVSGYSAETSDSFEEYIETGIKANLRVGTILNLGKSFGLNSQVKYGSDGTTTVHFGIVIRTIAKKAAEHRGTYYWYK